ncbi:hypothetical protein WJX72_003372 [[Myrmecia] bisecta]|uniref:Uncharacterized protein n=1 Tax=[Myrmecia] bisecta TaxID=41462 RepID=A0AAW1R5D7_9CHLO
MTSQINSLSANHATYQANPTSATLHDVVMGIVDYVAHPDHLDQVRALETNPSYALVQQQMAVRRKQQCVDLLNSSRKLGQNSKIPQDAIDCVCNKFGDNIPYYVCNARYHQVLVPTVIDYVGKTRGPTAASAPTAPAHQAADACFMMTPSTPRT